MPLWPRLPPGHHWGSSGCSPDPQLDLMPLLDREWKGRIRKGRGGKKKGGYGQEGNWPQKGELGVPSLKCSCSQTLLVGYVLKLNAECNNKQQSCFMAVYIHGSCVITSHLIRGQSVSDCRVNVRRILRLCAICKMCCTVW